MLKAIILLIYVASTSLGLIAIKQGTGEGLPISFNGDRVQFHLNFFSIIGILLYGLSFVLYVYLISKFDLGYIIPLTTALVYVVIFIASYFIFKEVFTLMKVIGIALIVSGVIFLSLGK